MPNWCNTRMTITGSEEECKRFMDGVKVEEIERKIYDYSTPYPHTIIDVTMETNLCIISGFLPCPEELREVAHPTQQAQAEQAEQMLAKHGAKDWYEWESINWGVKWGDCHTLLEDEDELPNGDYEVVYSFDTPWGTATPAFIRISKMFPELRFDFFHEEEAGFFQGCQVIKNGELFFEEFFSPCEYGEEAPEGVSIDSDEWNEKYDAWRHEQQEEIDALLDKVVC